MATDTLRFRLLRAALMIALGLGFVGLGCVLFPESNLGGGFSLVGGVIILVGAVVLFVTVIAWVVGILVRR